MSSWVQTSQESPSNPTPSSELEQNFSVSVRHQIWEELPEKAEFYRGIYSVTLNYLVSVMFVPEFKITQDNWPPVLPEKREGELAL